MNLKILVSVVLPSHNSEKYIAESIQSILNQTHTNLELIVVNDHSSDGTVEVVRKFKDNRIRLFENHPGKGLVDALNFGIQQASGTFIARMDSDDIAIPSRLEKQVNFLNQNNSVIAVGMDALSFGEDVRLLTFPKEDERLKARLSRSVCFVHPTVMIRKNILIQNSLFYNKEMIYAEDWDFWIRLSKHGDFAQIKELGLLYRVHKNSVTQSKKTLASKYERMILDKYSGSFEQCKIEDILTNASVARKNRRLASLLLLYSCVFLIEPLATIQDVMRLTFYRIFGSFYIRRLNRRVKAPRIRK